jgi:uncharacterized phage protein (TIGR01671 family)
MRPIKFRFWIKKEKRYDGPNGLWWNFTEYLDEDDCVVEQFTGLRDRAGREIYEWDILGMDDFVAGVVVFNEASFCIDAGLKIQSPSALHSDRTRLYKVIGNIHENPSLLSERGEGKEKA